MIQKKSSFFKEISIMKNIERFMKAERNKSRGVDRASSTYALGGASGGTSIARKTLTPKVKK